MSFRFLTSIVLACALSLQLGTAHSAKKKEKKPPAPPATHEVCFEAMGSMMGGMQDGRMMSGKGHSGMGHISMCANGTGCKGDIKKVNRDVAWCPEDGQCVGMGLKNNAAARGYCGGYLMYKKSCKTGKEKECATMRMYQRRTLRVMIDKITNQLRLMGDKHPSYRHLQARRQGLEDLLYTVERSGK